MSIHVAIHTTNKVVLTVLHLQLYKNTTVCFNTGKYKNTKAAYRYKPGKKHIILYTGCYFALPSSLAYRT